MGVVENDVLQLVMRSVRLMFELSSPQFENTANLVHEPNSILFIVNTGNIVVVLI